MYTGQYYFSKQKLQELLKKFDSDSLQGFVFMLGRGQDGQPSAFAFPLMAPATGSADQGNSLKENVDPSLAGCPYPPPC